MPDFQFEELTNLLNRSDLRFAIDYCRKYTLSPSAELNVIDNLRKKDGLSSIPLDNAISFEEKLQAMYVYLNDIQGPQDDAV